jgi:transposase
MLDVDRITDFDQLKQVTRILHKENQRLHEKLAKYVRELAKLRGENAQRRLALEISQLQSQMDAVQRQLGKVSEKRGSGEPKDDEAKPPRRGHGPRLQPKLAIEEQVHELPEDERRCPACNGQLEQMGEQFEDSEEITVVQRQFKLIRRRRRKYRCRCNGAVVTASGPKGHLVRPGGRYSVEFAVEVAVDKYLNHIPLDRQRRMMLQQGLLIDTQTLWDQLYALYGHLEPSYDALLERILGQPQIGADETWWRLMDRKGGKKWWDWCLASPDAVYHRLHPSREAEVVEKLLAGYDGVVMSDGFAAYETLTRAGPAKYRSAHCWAHVRRKFIELEPLHPEPCGEVLDLIRDLYGLEKTVPDTADAAELRRKTRDEQSRKVVAAIRDWAIKQRSSPQSGLRKAIDYMFGLWPGLKLFLDDPAVPLDNNATERALRGVVVGRKNHYGSRSERGTRVAALFYSLIETAKLCGVEPKDYLLQAAKVAIEVPGTVSLPHDLLPTDADAAA